MSDLNTIRDMLKRANVDAEIAHRDAYEEVTRKGTVAHAKEVTVTINTIAGLGNNRCAAVYLTFDEAGVLTAVYAESDD